METRRPAKDIFLHSGNHWKLQEANELVEKARKLEDEVREEQSKHRETLKADYSYKVFPDFIKEDKWSRLPDNTEVIRIIAELKNKKVFEDHMRKYGSLFMPPEDTRRSVTYYRKHGILFHKGGGWLLLKDEQPCSDEDWEDLKKGNIEKFM